ncbi:MAG: adenylate/guanylate cyclase domain-containing protein [Anaerolineae bacterium]
MMDGLPRLVARVPTTVHTKLLVAFLAIAALLITVGVVGLRVLSDVNRRAANLVTLERKIGAYRQLQHDTTRQLYTVASALLAPNERTLDATLRQLREFGYDLDRLQFVAKDEVEVFGQVRRDYEKFMEVVAQVVELLRAGKVTEGRELQLTQAGLLADRLERLTNELVNRVEADMVESIEASQEAYATSRWVVIGFAIGSIGLALVLGYGISWSLIGPVRRMDQRLREIASGDFSQRVDVPNRDELGTLSANLNRMNEEIGRLYRTVQAQAAELTEWNKTLEHRVQEQVGQLDRLGRLKRFFSPQLAELIVAGSADDPLKTHRREVTVVFVDLRGFTAFAETSEPEEVMGVLREYHTEMGKLILLHEGTLERFTGDGMMVFFNDPIPVAQPAHQAIRMALAMRDRVAELIVDWRKRAYELAFGIGIAHGYATIGAIGFEGRWDYAAIGTVTNLAARLCGEAKPGQILIPQRLLGTVDELVEVEPVGELTLKGLLKPVPTFNVVGLKSP